MLSLKELLAITLYPIPYSAKAKLLAEGTFNKLNNFKTYLELAEKHIDLLLSKGVKLIPFFQIIILKR